jgi:hypothetical protein
MPGSGGVRSASAHLRPDPPPPDQRVSRHGTAEALDTAAAIPSKFSKSYGMPPGLKPQGSPCDRHPQRDGCPTACLTGSSEIIDCMRIMSSPRRELLARIGRDPALEGLAGRIDEVFERLDEVIGTLDELAGKLEEVVGPPASSSDGSKGSLRGSMKSSDSPKRSLRGSMRSLDVRQARRTARRGR